ncbi:MAG: glycosyltransferase [Candidatus Methylomirabilales bacterium]
MNIGIFTCNFSPLVNGLSVSISRYAEYFRRFGHQVFIFAPRYSGHREREPGVFRLPSLRVPTHRRYTLPLPISPRLNKVIQDLELDILHAQHPFLLGPWALNLARRLGLPLVFTYHTLYEHYAHYVPLLQPLAAKLALKKAVEFANQADLVIAPTWWVRRLLLNLGIHVPIEVVPTGVELPEEIEDPVSLRAHLNLEPEARVLLYLGRLAKEKNLVLLLHAFHLITKALPQALLLLVGEGDAREELETLAQELGLERSVRFVGLIPHGRVWSFYRLAQAFLFPSITEAQGLVILEAMAVGVPVVAIKDTAAEDFIEDGQDGFLVEEAVEAFAEAVIRLLGDEGLRSAMGQRAQRKAGRFTAKASAERMLELYQKLVARVRP